MFPTLKLRSKYYTISGKIPRRLCTGRTTCSKKVRFMCSLNKYDVGAPELDKFGPITNRYYTQPRNGHFHSGCPRFPRSYRAPTSESGKYIGLSNAIFLAVSMARRFAQHVQSYVIPYEHGKQEYISNQASSSLTG